MLSLREYLLAVHELEMKIYIEEKILPAWINFQTKTDKQLREKLIEPAEMALNNIQNTIHNKPHELFQLNEKLKDLEKELTTTKATVISPKNSFGLVESLWYGFLMALAFTIPAYIFDAGFTDVAFDSIIPYAIAWCIGFIYVLWDLFKDSRKKKSEQKQETNEKEQKILQEIKTTKEKIERLSTSYEKDLSILNQKTAIYKQDLENAKKRYNQEMTPITEKVLALKLTIHADTLKLHQLYKANIIHPKYRGLIPVSMFYDYVDTGRCSTLTGHEGAYNIYESELRDQIIFDKLDKINNNIQGMQKSMYFFSTRMQSALKTISQNMITSADQINSSFAALNAHYSSLQSSTDGILKQLQDGVEVKFE